jgi:hypothetical protein
MPRHLALLLALALALPLFGCGGDDDDGGPGPIEPPPPGGLLVPEEYATIVDALAFADVGDTVSLAAGSYTVDASVERAVTIRGREPGVVLTDSRFTVRASGIGAVRLEDLAMTGGDTALVVQGDMMVEVYGVTFADLALGILHRGDGTLVVDRSSFTGLGPGGAVHGQAEASVNLHTVTVTDCTAGDRGVVWVGEAAGLSISEAEFAGCTASQAVVNLETSLGAGLMDVSFVDCIPYAVRHRARDLGLMRCAFDGLEFPAVAVGEGSTAEIDSCAFTGGRWPQLEVGGELDVTTSVITAGSGDEPAIMVGAGGVVSMDLCTVHSGVGPWVSVGSGATLEALRSLVTEVAVPAVRRLDPAPAQIALDYCDLWDPVLEAWEGLEAQRDDGEGNVSVDPLYCDPGVGDLRLQTGTPVPTWGALDVGCE